MMLGVDVVVEKPLMINENKVLLKNKTTLLMPKIRAWALIAYAFHNIVYSFNFYGKYYETLFSSNRLIAIPLIGVEIVFSILLIVGLLGIYFAPSLKHIGQVGLLLMILSPINNLLFLIPLLAQGYDQIESFLTIPFFYIQYHLLAASFLVPHIGYVIIGWLTIKTKVFPKWAGVLLLFSGLFYFATFYIGHYLTSDLYKATYITAVLTEALALAIYGQSILSTSKSAE